MAPSTDIKNVDGGTWINDEFLQEILKEKHADAKSIFIVNKEVSRPFGKGENYLSIIYQIKIEYRIEQNRDTEMIHLIVKSYPDGELMQKIVGELKVFDRELTMYQIVLPQFYQFAEKQKSNFPSLSPQCYSTSRKNTLVLEDLRECGYKMADRKKRLDLQHCRLVLDRLAKFHGISAVLYQNDPNTLSKCDKIMWCKENRDTVCKFIPRQMKVAADVAKSWEGFETVSEKFSNFVPNALDRFLDATELQKDGFHVLIHGDCWINNMLFKYSPNGEPIDVKFVDFQISQVASPAMDLSYFLYSSPQNEVRDTQIENLLQEYHRQLCDTINVLGGNPELFPYEDLQAEMKRMAYFGIVTSVMSLGVILAHADDVPDLENMKEEDMDNEDLKFFENIYNMPSFREAYAPLLCRFDKYGLFD